MTAVDQRLLTSRSVRLHDISGKSSERRDSEVTFELTEADEVVQLTILQTGFEDARSYRSASGGWSFITSNLKTQLETGQTLPMPAKVLAAYR